MRSFNNTIVRTLAAGILVMAFARLSAQLYNVTFQVDMRLQTTIHDTISVAGNFQVAAGYPSDWTPGTTRLSDMNVDSIYDITVQLPAGSYEYKFINGTMWGQDESVPGACQVNGNRGITVLKDTIIPVVCFSMCASCPPPVYWVDVTFHVNMSNESVPGIVSVAGDFQTIAGQGTNWTPGMAVLTDGNLDNIYDLTVTIPAGTYSYSFINGITWEGQEMLPCTCSDGGYRSVNIAGPGPVDIPVTCFSHCDTSCPVLGSPLPVIFQVDMNNETVDPGGVFISGNFQSPPWVKDTLQMMDPNMDGIYSITVNIEPEHEYQYKYYNGPLGDPDAETADFVTLGCGCDNGIGGTNRILDLYGASGTVYLAPRIFNSCDISPLELQEPQTDFSFVVYPNPFSESTKVNITNLNGQVFTASLYNFQGQELRKFPAQQESTLTVSRDELVPGVYILRLDLDEGSSQFRKLIIVD